MGVLTGVDLAADGAVGLAARDDAPRRLLGTRGALVGAIVGSRALVLLCGATAAAVLGRADRWHVFDPSRVSERLGTVGNLVAASAVRWDSVWYLHIAAHGYDSLRSTAFFPLLPLLIHVLTWPLGSPVAAGMLISLVSFGIAMLLLHRLTELELGPEAADGAVLLLAFAPLAVFFTAVYTESLFLALSLATVYAARRDRWLLAGVAGGLAAATRVTGVLLIVLLVLPISAGARQGGAGTLRSRAWVGLVPAGLLGFLAFLGASGWSPLDPLSAQSTAEHGHRLLGPVSGLVEAIQAAGSGLAGLLAGSQPVWTLGTLGPPLSMAAENVALLLVLVLALLALFECRRLPAAYGVYGGLALATALSSPIAAEPLKSLDRYTLTMFPLWMVGGAWLSRRAHPRWLVIGSGAGLVCMTVQFSAWSFVA